MPGGPGGDSARFAVILHPTDERIGNGQGRAWKV